VLCWPIVSLNSAIDCSTQLDALPRCIQENISAKRPSMCCNSRPHKNIRIGWPTESGRDSEKLHIFVPAFRTDVQSVYCNNSRDSEKKWKRWFLCLRDGKIKKNVYKRNLKMKE